jgi:hypothetical protein
MLKSINDGNFYIKNRNNQEQKLKKNENGIEGFDVISRQFQQKHSSKFDIPSNADPGQTVMCQVDKIRYVRLSQQNKHLTVQEVEVYDENGKNVALADSFSNNYQLTKGKCRTPNDTTGYPGPIHKGNLTVQQCEDKCAQDKSCSAYEIQSEESTEGINPNCWIYRDPSVTGNGDPNEMCRVRERLSGTPTVTMSAIYPNTNPYLAIDGKHDPRQKWPNSACTFKEGGWWELDLGKLVNVKKIVIYNRPDGNQSTLDRLNGATVSLIDRDHNTVWTKTLNSNRRQEFPVKFSNQNCGGPVIEKNMDDFEVLKELQIKYYKELQLYNQAVKDLVENSRDYVNASNMNNNKFHNKYIRESNGAISYVTNRGVSKHLPNPTIADSIQGQNGCPPNWRTTYQNLAPDEGQEYSIYTAPYGNIIKMDGQELIKGSNMIQNQSCSNAGQNLYVTEPSIPTAPQYLQCSRNAGSYQSDLGTTTFNRCKQRAADEGSNVFSMGPNEGNSKGKCYIGGGGGRIVKDSICPVAPGVGRMGGKVRSRRKGFKKIRGYYVFATYETENANNSNLGDTFHITDNLTKKQYWAGNVNKDSTEFQMIPGYGSRGNDITSGSGLSIEQIKQKCLDTPNSAGFTFNVNNGKYYIKNKNMWPRGTRHATSNAQLYIRLPSVLNDISCSNEVKSTTSTNIMSYSSDGRMTPQTKCALGTISRRDNENINAQYQKLNVILDKMHKKIIELSTEDIILNKKLLSEYKLLKNRLHKYEDAYKNIKKSKQMGDHNAALEEDANLNMLSYNQQYILWSIVALGITIGAMKYIK